MRKKRKKILTKPQVFRFKEFMDEKNLTQKMVGDVIGVRHQAVSDFLRGKSSLTKRNLRVISDNFRLNPDWLLTGKGKMLLPEGKEKATYIMPGAKKFPQIQQILRLFDGLDEDQVQALCEVVKILSDVMKKPPKEKSLTVT